MNKLVPMTISYDDPLNLKDARGYRASLGFIMEDFDMLLYERFKKVGYLWTSLPATKGLYGEMTYRNASSVAFGYTRFIPSAITYMMRNQKRMKEVLAKLKRFNMIEII
jgi:hypothetical protein